MINANRLKEVAAILKKELPELGFSLIVFEFNTKANEPHEFRYISNAQREDMLESLSALLIKWENENPKNN